MKATKRLLALFLCLVMLFTTVPVEAFATGEDTSGETALNETPNQDNGNGEQAGAEEPAAQSEEATGKIIRAYLNPTKDDGNGRIYVDLGNVHYNASVELKLYSGETLLTTATLNTTEFPAPRTFNELTGSICMVAGKSDTWPNTEWIASEDAVPDKIELVVDGIVVDTIGKIQVKRDGGEMTAEDWIAFPNTLQMHTVTYTDGVDGEEIFADQKYTVEVGKETPAFEGTPARKGYNFIGWSSEVSDTVTGNVTYVAQWKAITYSIMYNAGEGSYVGPALSSGDNWMLIKNGYTYDAPVTLYGGEDFVRPGYTLVGWIVQGETYALGQTIERNFHTVQNGTVQAYAIWQANTYTIKYNAGEGAYVGSEPNSGDDWMLIKNGYTYDAPVTLHSGEGFVRDGYTLVGWIIDDEAYMAGQTVEKNFDTVQGGTVQAYAIWSANTYTIKYNAGEGMYVGTDLNRNDKWLLIKNGYTYDAPVTLYNGDGFVRPGYELLGWIIDEQTYALGQTVEINFTKVQSGTVQAYAVWNANNYTLTLDPNGGKVDPTSITVTYDAAIGELPVPTWAKGSFLGWYDEQGNQVTAETIYTVAGDSTITAKWLPNPDVSYVTNELFTVQCTENHDHAWLVNWFTNVNFVTNSVKWNEELGRWEAQCKIGSSFMTFINSTQPKKNYFGGIKHFYDETNYVFDLYYDPNFTGLNSAKKEVTGMWLPVQEYVVPVYCYTAPGMPNLSKVSSALLWVRDAGNKNSTHSQKFTVKQLPEGSYTMGQMYTQNGKFYVDVTITDLSAFIAALGEKTGKTYVLPVWEKHYNSADDFSFTLEYTGSTTDYKQDGTGWAVAASTWANNTEKLNGKSLWLTEQYTVTYTDGAEGKVFADQVYTVNAYSENGKTANAVTDFSATATPVFEVPARKGYTHTGWTPEVAATVTGNAAYEAVWTLNVYNITVEANQGGTVEVQETATFNEVVKLAITPNTGYRVVSAKLHYEIDGTPYTANLVDAVRFKMPAADVKIVVEFEQIIYNIEVEFNAGGTVTVQDTAVYGEIVKLAVTPNTGYRVVSAKMHYVSSKGVPVTTELLGADKFKMPAADVKIVVEFEQVIYNITVEAGEHGSVTVQDTAVYAEIVKLAVTPDTGYGVVSAKMHYVSSKGVPVTTELLGADKFKMPAADVTIVVEFAANQYNVTFNSNGGAAIDPITVTFDAAYGKLPTASSVNGFTNPKNSWFLVDEQGNITAVNVRSNTIVSTARDHQLIQKREIFVGAVKVERTPTGAYVGTEYTLTATVANYNGELLNYTYQWYKDGVAIDGATEATLVLPGNYSDNGTYTVTVTATKKDTCSIITWNESASKDGSYTLKLSKIANTLRLNENYGEHPVTSDSYTGGNALSIRSAAVRTGYTFLGWNTAADGSGTMYQKGDSVPFVDTIGNGGIIVELFAQWKANEYVVSYNTNGGAAVADKVVTFDAKYGVMPTSSVTGLSARKTDWYLVDENGNVTDTNIRNTTVVSVARDHTLFLMRDVLAPTLKITLEVPGAISNDYKYYVPGNSTRVLTVTVNNKNEDVLNYSYQWYKDNAPIEGATEAVLTLPGNVSDSGIYKVVVTATLKDGTGIVVKVNSASGEKEQKVQIMRAANTLRLNENHGETPVTSDSYFGGAEFTIRSAAQARTGYTFLGWNTEADGSGTMYQAGDIAEFPGDNGNGGVVLELFAQWKANTYTVTLNANGGTVEPATLTVTFGQPIGELPIPVKPGHTFVGWTVAEKNSRAVELVTAETVYDLNADVTLIAVWNVNNYTLTLDANGGKADKDSVAVTYDAVIGELPVPTRTGYTFAGWFDAEGKEITAETVYTVAGDSTATAKWTVNTYKITLDPKGGDLKKGEETVEVTFGEAVGVLPIPSRTGYIFVGWFDAEDKEVTKDTIYELTEDTTLVAKWYVHKPADPSSPPTGDGMTMFVMASMLISAGALLFLLERKRRVQA